MTSPPPVPAGRVALVGAAAVGAGAVAAAVGVGLSVLVAGTVDEGMRGLGVLVIGLLVTLFVALGALVAVAVVGARRVVPAGRRAAAVVAVVTAVVVVLVVAWATTTAWVLLLALPAGVLAPVAVTRR